MEVGDELPTSLAYSNDTESVYDEERVTGKTEYKGGVTDMGRKTDLEV